MNPLLIAPLLACMLAAFLFFATRSRKRTRAPEKGVLLQPEAFCAKMREANCGLVVITHVGRPSLTPTSGRRFEFKAMASDKQLFRTFFDDESEDGSGIPSIAPPSAARRTATYYLRLMMQYAVWHTDKSEGSLFDPTKYVGKPKFTGTMCP